MLSFPATRPTMPLETETRNIETETTAFETETRAFETETETRPSKIGLETSRDRDRSRDFNIPGFT